MPKRRRIAVIAPPWYPVPVDGYGGIELVVDLHVRGLEALGHEVILYGAEGSRPGTIELAPASYRAAMATYPDHLFRLMTYVERVFADIARRRDEIDIIHDHTGWDGMGLVRAGQFADVPAVHTTHGPLGEMQCSLYNEVGDAVGLVAISNSQRHSAPALNWVGTVHNAVDIDKLWIGSRADKEPYLLSLARISPEKGQHHAIEVARRTGYRLVLAGKVAEYRADVAYWHEQVKPHIDNDRVVYIPSVGGSAKANLLARATAMLAPLTWEEPFGLSYVESMASGTPCIGIARGALPELVVDGETGFLGQDVDDLVEAVGRVGEIDPYRCAALTRTSFCPDAMAEGYLNVYDRILGEAQVLELTGSGTTLAHDDLEADSAALAAASLPLP